MEKIKLRMFLDSQDEPIYEATGINLGGKQDVIFTIQDQNEKMFQDVKVKSRASYLGVDGWYYHDYLVELYFNPYPACDRFLDINARWRKNNPKV